MVLGLIDAFLPSQLGASSQRDLQAGEVLWDRSNNEEQALAISCSPFLQRLPDFNRCTLGVQGVHRDVELVLGICANLAATPTTALEVLQTEAVHAIAQAALLHQTEPQCLAEACRLLLASLQAAVPQIWLLTESEAQLDRLVWTAENTLHQVLLDRCWLPQAHVRPGPARLLVKQAVCTGSSHRVNLPAAAGHLRCLAVCCSKTTMCLKAWTIAGWPKS